MSDLTLEPLCPESNMTIPISHLFNKCLQSASHPGPVPEDEHEEEQSPAPGGQVEKTDVRQNITIVPRNTAMKCEDTG